MCGSKANQRTTISGLDPASRYVFQVCVVGQIVVGQYSNLSSETTKATGPPGKPSIAAATTETITIAFTKPKNIGEGVMIEKYKFDGSTNSQHMHQVLQYTEYTSLTCTIKGHSNG